MSTTIWHCECGAKYEIPEVALGRKVRCSHCGVVTRVEKPSSIKAPPPKPKTSLPSRETSSLPLNKTEVDEKYDRERNLSDTLMQIESWDVDAAIRSQVIDIALAVEDAGIKTFDKLVANSVEGAIEEVVNPPVGRVTTESSDQISRPLEESKLSRSDVGICGIIVLAAFLIFALFVSFLLRVPFWMAANATFWLITLFSATVFLGVTDSLFGIAGRFISMGLFPISSFFVMIGAFNVILSITGKDVVGDKGFMTAIFVCSLYHICVPSLSWLACHWLDKVSKESKSND
jgi:hypothetical protein